MEELVSISVTLGERRYPLKIRAGEEAPVREAETMINEKFNEFQLRFTGQEKIDYLAMSVLMIVVDLLKHKSIDGNSSVEIVNKLAEVETLIADTLKKN
ncbi:MAG: cell division protein ZapA [Chitinophagales bacterium]|nr:cell division protein ZapA [Chitinophagales bacterium]